MIFIDQALAKSHSVLISVITPTYNRAHTLPAVFAALMAQTRKCFEWIVIDDGSNDGTEALVATWKADFPISYIYQKNSGKPCAVNLGVRVATAEYVCVLDSDDIPRPDTFEYLEARLFKLKIELVGIAVNTCNSNNRIHGTPNPVSEFEGTMLEAYSTGRLNGDKWLVTRRSILSAFPSPSITGEKFIPEAVSNFRLSRADGAYLFADATLLQREYLSDGYTASGVGLRMANPIGFLMLDFESMVSEQARLSSFYIKAAANICRTFYLTSRRPLLTVVLLLVGFPIGILKGWRDSRRFSACSGGAGSI